MQGNYKDHPRARKYLLGVMRKNGYDSISQVLNNQNITLLPSYRVEALRMFERENPPITKKRIKELKQNEKLRTIRYHKKEYYDRPGSTIHIYYNRKE